jgi:hypothetical protein
MNSRVSAFTPSPEPDESEADPLVQMAGHAYSYQAPASPLHRDVLTRAVEQKEQLNRLRGENNLLKERVTELELENGKLHQDHCQRYLFCLLIGALIGVLVTRFFSSSDE